MLVGYLYADTQKARIPYAVFLFQKGTRNLRVPLGRSAQKSTKIYAKLYIQLPPDRFPFLLDEFPKECRRIDFPSAGLIEESPDLPLRHLACLKKYLLEILFDIECRTDFVDQSGPR